jgi:hypothetical protein
VLLFLKKLHSLKLEIVNEDGNVESKEVRGRKTF